MKKYLLLAHLLLTQLCYGQSVSRTKVPGTKCSIIPPEEFVEESSIGGFQDILTGAIITIGDIPVPYQTVIEKITDESYKRKGINLISKQTIDFRGGKATLYYTSQSTEGKIYLKQSLVFGGANYTVVANGTYPETSKSLEAKIKKSLLSTVYDPLQEKSIPEAESFKVDVTNTDLKLTTNLSGALLYSADGRMPTDQPTLLVSSALSRVAVQNQEDYAKTEMKQLPNGENITLKQVRKVLIDNLSGYELIGFTKTTESRPDLFFLVILFDNAGNHYTILGHACERSEEYTKIFRKVAGTFKRK